MKVSGGNGRTAIVVGGGIFGSITARALARDGWLVKLLADPLGFDQSGSRPAACLMADNWLSAMGKQDRAQGFKLLEELYDLQTLTFEVRAMGGLLSAKTNSVKWVDPRSILCGTHANVLRVAGRVTQVDPTGDKPWLSYTPHQTRALVRLTADLIVVAAGVHTHHLLPVNGLQTKARWGAAHTWEAKGTNYIAPYAPYRQVVGFNRRANEYWSGDGMALKEDSVTADRLRKSRLLTAKHSGMEPEEATMILGARPYPLERLSTPCAVVWAGPNTVGITGGGKNGTIAAAWAAAQLLDAL